MKYHLTEFFKISCSYASNSFTFSLNSEAEIFCPRMKFFIDFHKILVFQLFQGNTNHFDKLGGSKQVSKEIRK